MAKKSNGTTQKLQYRLNESKFIEVKKSLPKGYEIIEGTLTQPAGTRWARKKGVSLFKRDKSGKIIGRNPKYKDCLVVIDEDYFTSRIADDRVYRPSLAKNFITDATTERKIAAKEKRERKRLQEQKERDKHSIEEAIAREEAKKKTATTGAKVQSRKSAPTAPKSSSFTVKAGRTTRTFATKAEAQAFAQQCKNRNVSITPSTRKPTHKLVSFTAKKQ